MEVSGFLYNITKLAIDTLIKTTKADIRIHGKENIPNQPILYVINHFTRMETFFLPYVINKISGKNILSLAFHGFFGGGFGNYLSKIGAVSTKSPDRDKIMINSLLKGDMSCLIFPEGQMIKDKKLIERGKYMVYNTGIRRPPHTGSAIIALRSQFYREKLRYFYENDYDEGIDEYLKYFEIESKESIEKIINQETYIVPVNITYYPIRARNNIINRIAERFVEKVPKRLEEELEVEGSMLIDGVDIDINFGEPIPTRNYLSNKYYQRRIQNRRLLLKDDETKREINFRRQGINLMYRYMDSIYQMTTVNHDHIFSYLITKYKKRRIEESDFKNRAYLAINRIKDIHLKSYHSTLMQKQGYLLTDDEHGRYNDAVEAAISDGLIRLKDGYIIKNIKRFSKPHEFHTIRKDNIIEVLKNEIEPMKELVTTLDRVMRIPDFLIRRQIREAFIKRDSDIFEKDYRKFYIEGESKPKNIGAPFFLKRFNSRRGVLLIHGYMAAPEEIRVLADYLFKRGFSVYGVRLRGHGTAPEDLASRRWEEWYESANRGYIVLKNSVKNMAVAGFSTGAGLALLQAVNKGKRFRCVISINAPLKLKNIASHLASAVVFWNTIMKKMHIKRGEMEFVTNRPENPHINYFRNPVYGVYQLEQLMNAVEGRLGELDIPALVIQGSNDPVVNPESAEEVFEKMGTKDKDLCTVFSERHGIIRGDGSEKVFEKVELFLNERC
jgi:esterase/lipase/1-acyl-sn-glycerol-3-phosphate acyltransferase